MEKLGFVTDSTAYLDPAFIDKHQIEVASLIVNFEGESIQEVDLYGEYDQFYDKLRRVTYLPTTSQPSLGVFLELYPHEKKYIYKLVPISIILFVSGVVFAYFTIFPLAVYVLITLASEFEPMLTISKYLSFCLNFLIPFGLVFEFPLIVYFLTKIGVITPQWLLHNRKYAIVIAFVLAAVLTPGPDPLSQLLMAAPMVVLYEVSIIVSKVVAKKRNAKFNELNGEEVE